MIICEGLQTTLLYPTDDPYRLCEMAGIGFTTADKIVMSMKPSKKKQPFALILFLSVAAVVVFLI